MVVGKKTMFPLGARIWVLITDGANARICSSEDGLARPISAPIFPPEGAFDRHVSVHEAWFKADGQRRLSPNPRRQHLWHLSQLLLEGARDGAYDGVIVIAAAPVASVLREMLAPETCALLIGDVVLDFSMFDPATPNEPAEIRH